MTTRLKSIRTKKGKEKPPPKPNPVPKIEAKPISITDYLIDSISSFPKFASRLLKIQTLNGELRDYEFNSIQRLLERIVDLIIERGRLVRVVVLKARREGVSTWVSGRYFWKTVTNKNRYSMIICHEPEATDFVFNMHRRFLSNLPEFLRPAERYNNKKMLEFNNDSGTGLDSAIRVGTAAKEDFGSSQMINYLHLSELAKYPRHIITPLLTSLLQCVPDKKDTAVIIESTAKGVGGEFYKRYWECRHRFELYLDSDGEVQIRESVNKDAPEDNEYTSIFIPWFVFDEYQRPVPSNFKATPEEAVMMAKYNISPARIMWRRWAIENKCHGDVKVFNQEYPPDPKSAFMSSAGNVFPPELVDERMSKAKPPMARYECHLTTGNWLANPEGRFKVWSEPQMGREYIVSMDVAEGIVKGDFSSLDVIDCVTGEQCVHFRDHVPPDHFGMLGVWVASRYNKAIIVVERNNHGMATIEKISSMGYNKIYFELIADMPPMKPRKRFGWVTTKRSKPVIIDNLAAELRDNLDGIKALETLSELLTFKQFEDGELGAEEGFFDDRVISYAIGKFVRTKLPRYNRMKKIAGNPNIYYNSAVKPVPPTTVPSGAWT
jgi:hypothetical protein